MKKFIKLFAVMAVTVMMFAGCSSKENAPATLTSRDMVDIITECGGEPAEYNPAVEMNAEGDMNLDFFYEMYEWDKANYEEGAMSFSLMNISAYNIAIAKPAEGKTDAVKAEFEDYKAKIMQNFDRYLPDPYAIAEATIIEEVNGYVVMVMTEDAQSVYEAISAKLK